MFENTDIVSNARRHKLHQETITSPPKNAIVLGKKKKREMEKNKYIISSVNKTRDKVEASEKSIKEEKSSPT